MVSNKSIIKHLAKFYEIVDDTENIEVKIEDEDKILLFFEIITHVLRAL